MSAVLPFILYTTTRARATAGSTDGFTGASPQRILCDNRATSGQAKRRPTGGGKSDKRTGIGEMNGKSGRGEGEMGRGKRVSPLSVGGEGRRLYLLKMSPGYPLSLNYPP